MMSKHNLDVHKYWEERLASSPNLKGTGHRAFSLGYNQYLYQAQLNCLVYLLDKWKVGLLNSRVLDIGSGLGFYIDFYRDRGAGEILGMDISETSVSFLKEKYPADKFLLADISNCTLDGLGEFDFISVVSVLYHVVED
ncbi:MAG: class I SAM-dependent methyltransferase, partial [Acidobacteriaceae bacterium]